jgi:hypothetical protein
VDVLYILLTLILFGAGHAYVRACARLKGKGQS